MADENPRNLEQEIPLLAIYKEPHSNQYVVESNAKTGEELDAAFAHLATTFARALARPENRTP